MAKVNRWESVGWVFWNVCFLLSLPGCIYLTRSLSYSNVSVFGYIVFGFMLAGGVASVITWLTNTILGVFAERARKREQHNSKQRKKKSKAK